VPDFIRGDFSCGAGCSKERNDAGAVLSVLWKGGDMTWLDRKRAEVMSGKASLSLKDIARLFRELDSVDRQTTAIEKTLSAEFESIRKRIVGARDNLKALAGLREWVRDRKARTRRKS
jgi:hypothetical protein